MLTLFLISSLSFDSYYLTDDCWKIIPKFAHTGGYWGCLFAFKGAKKKKKKLKRWKRKQTDIIPNKIYCLAFQVPTFRISSVLYLMYLIFHTSSLFEGFSLSSVQQRSNCVCAMMMIGVSILDKIKGKSHNI